ncbi:MAG: dienelactone hydrolase family protein [Anaerolineales bacterium]|nr:dienelactone hydrolase family protein [Anaerolineales bacterium]
MQLLQIQDWVIRFREPENAGPHQVIWLFHGWKGDEHSMEVFSSLIPEDYLILAPRGQYPTQIGGFSWYPIRENGWAPIEAFFPAVYELVDLMENWPLAAPWADFDRFHLAGFSQGAALAYTFTLLYPERVKALAGLAGFLPRNANDYLDNKDFRDKPVYIFHGTEDQIVPVEMAVAAAQFFNNAGSEVTFCESDVGHKLSVDCFKGLDSFFRRETK